MIQGDRVDGEYKGELRTLESLARGEDILFSNMLYALENPDEPARPVTMTQSYLAGSKEEGDDGYGGIILPGESIDYPTMLGGGMRPTTEQSPPPGGNSEEYAENSPPMVRVELMESPSPSP